MVRKIRMSVLAGGTLFLMVFGGYLLQAQERLSGDPGAAGDRPPGPAHMQAMMLERFQNELDVSDQEWPVLKPLIADVMKLQTSQMPGPPGMMGPGGGSGPMGPPPDRQNNQSINDANNTGGPPSPGQMGGAIPEAKALKLVIDSEDATNEEILAKLTAYREAKAMKELALRAAREKLRAILTLRQESILVLAGLLD